MDLRTGDLSSVGSILKMQSVREEQKAEKGTLPFSEFLKQAVYNVSDSQKYVEQLNERMMAGKLDNLHEVPIAAEIANINFLTLVNVKNKVMDAYREILRIQI